MRTANSNEKDTTISLTQIVQSLTLEELQQRYLNSRKEITRLEVEKIILTVIVEFAEEYIPSDQFESWDNRKEEFNDYTIDFDC